MMFCDFLLLLLLTSINSATGLVEISPLSVVPAVCQERGQLELTCNTTSGLEQRWQFNVVSEKVHYVGISISIVGVSGIPIAPLSIGIAMVNFSRLSGQFELPLISRVTISPVSRGLNGTEVRCFEVDTNLVATTTIRISDAQQFELRLRPDSEHFLSDGVTVTLEWTLLNSQPYYQHFLGNVSVNANPQPKNVMFIGDMRVQLALSYNTLYNVSVTQHSTCRQLIRTTFIELNLSKCGDPMEQTTALAEGYVDPALEGQTITFICPRGLILSGSNSSTCMENGEWEPDPREVECTGTPVTTTTSIGMTAMLRISLISVTCVSVMMSVVTFIAGIICYHCISQRWRAASADINKPPGSHSNPKDTESELELKENVAYITLRPAA